MQKLGNLLLTLCCLAVTADAVAQASHAGRWFQIEVIVFTQNSPGGSSKLPRVETLPRPDDLQFLRASSEATRGSADLTRDPMIRLPRSQRTLNHLASKLEQSRGYRVLYHSAWRQPVLLRRDAQPIYLRGGGQVHETPELEGMLVPSVDFYLATEVDLRLSEPGTGGADTLPVGEADSQWHRQAAQLEPDIDGPGQRGGYGQRAERPAVKTVALQEKRGRMRSTELHYFDHPRMGMLIRYDRYSAPPLAPAAASEPVASEPAPAVSE